MNHLIHFIDNIMLSMNLFVKAEGRGQIFYLKIVSTIQFLEQLLPLLPFSIISGASKIHSGITEKTSTISPIRTNFISFIGCQVQDTEVYLLFANLKPDCSLTK